MTIEKEKEFDVLEKKRHEMEVKLMEALILAKEQERKEFEEARGQIKAQIQANTEY